MGVRKEILKHLEAAKSARSHLEKSREYMRLCGKLSNHKFLINRFAFLGPGDVENIKKASEAAPSDLNEGIRKSLLSFCDNCNIEYEPEPGEALAVGADTISNEIKIIQITVRESSGKNREPAATDDIFKEVRLRVKRLVEKFAAEKEPANLKRIMVEFQNFDDKLVCDVTGFDETCGGRSIMLPMAMAYFSFLLRYETTKCIENVIFTGEIDENLEISAGDIEAKARGVSREIPWCEKLVCPVDKPMKVGAVELMPCKKIEDALEKTYGRKFSGLILRPYLNEFAEELMARAAAGGHSTVSALLTTGHFVESNLIKPTETAQSILSRIVTGYLKHLHALKYIDRAVKIFEDSYCQGALFEKTGIDQRIMTIDYSARSYRELMMFEEAEKLFASLLDFFERGIQAPDVMNISILKWDIRKEKIYKNTLGAYFRSLFERYFSAGADREAIFARMGELLIKRSECETLEIALKKLEKCNDEFAKKMVYYYNFVAFSRSVGSGPQPNENACAVNGSNANDSVNLAIIIARERGIIPLPEEIKRLEGQISKPSHDTGNMAKIQIYYNLAVMALDAGDKVLALKLAQKGGQESSRRHKKLDNEILERAGQECDASYGSWLGNSLYDIYEYLFHALISAATSRVEALHSHKPVLAAGKRSPYTGMLDTAENIMKSIETKGTYSHVPGAFPDLLLY